MRRERGVAKPCNASRAATEAKPRPWPKRGERLCVAKAISAEGSTLAFGVEAVPFLTGLLWLRGDCHSYLWARLCKIPATPQPKHVFQRVEKRLPLAVASLRSVEMGARPR